MDLWVHDLKEDETKILSKGVGYGSLILSDDGRISSCVPVPSRR